MIKKTVNYKTGRVQKTCTCPAREFPHRLDELSCRDLYNSGSDETYMSRRELNAELLSDFDRTEARAINGNR